MRRYKRRRRGPNAALLVLVGLVIIGVVAVGGYVVLGNIFDELLQGSVAGRPLAVRNEGFGHIEAEAEAELTEPMQAPPQEVYIHRPPYVRQVDNSALPWYLKLVNRYNFIGYAFDPHVVSIGGGHYIDHRAAGSFHALMDAMRAEGLRPMVTSSFRTVARQRELFDAQVRRHLNNGHTTQAAFDMAARVIAYPGSSEHNLGLALDFISYNHRTLNAAFGQTPEGIWLAQNAHRYGFILRYAYDKQHITNIIYEPWHFRYVGATHAAYMFYNNLALEEYLVRFFY